MRGARWPSDTLRGWLSPKPPLQLHPVSTPGATMLSVCQAHHRRKHSHQRMPNSLQQVMSSTWILPQVASGIGVATHKCRLMNSLQCEAALHTAYHTISNWCAGVVFYQFLSG